MIIFSGVILEISLQTEWMFTLHYNFPKIADRLTHLFQKELFVKRQGETNLGLLVWLRRFAIDGKTESNTDVAYKTF